MKDKQTKYFARPTSYQLWPNATKTGKPVFIGTSSEVRKAPLQMGRYWLYAPHFEGFQDKVDEASLLNATYGNEAQKMKHFIIRSLLSRVAFSENKKKIEQILKDYTNLRYTLIHNIYGSLKAITNNSITGEHAPIRDTLHGIKPSMSELVRMGIDIYDPCIARELFEPFMLQNLIQYGFEDDVISTAIIAEIPFDDNSSRGGFGKFQDIVELCLELGKKIDLNIASQKNPKWGSFLHHFLAFELSRESALIEFLDSIRVESKPHTHFNFEALDGFGATPLMIALMTRNEKAATTFLQLAKEKNRLVGVHIPNAQGQSPLHIAIALGMKSVAEQLIALGASLDTLDKEGRTAASYAYLDEAEIRKLLSQYMHPDRCNSTITHMHSYLYVFDCGETTPLCLYNKGSEVKTGDAQIEHFVVLSNTSPHKERLDLAYNTLVEQVRAGDSWAAEQLPFVKNQIDDIRFSAQFNAVYEYLGQQSAEGNCFADYLLHQIQDLNGQSCLYENMLDAIPGFLKGINMPVAKLLLIEVEKIIRETPARKSILQMSMEGQTAMQEYIRQISKKGLQHEMRQAALSGQVEIVQKLLVEGVDPNSKDESGQTVFDALIEQQKNNANTSAQDECLQLLFDATKMQRRQTTLNKPCAAKFFVPDDSQKAVAIALSQNDLQKLNMNR
jgi:ankyrin repeat protein